MKKCSKCKMEKDPSEFHVRQAYCIACRKLANHDTQKARVKRLSERRAKLWGANV